MRTPIAILVATSMLLIGLPAASAGETVTAEYDVPSGANPATCGKGVYCAISTRPGASEWDEEWWCLEDDDVCEEPLDTVLGTVFSTGRDALGRGDDGWVRMGIFSDALASTCGDCYTSFLVSIVDTLPASTYYTFCIFTDYQDGRGGRDNTCGEVAECAVDPLTCDDIPDPRAQGCGSATLTSTVLSGGEVNSAGAFVYASFVDDSTGSVCLGSKGSLVVSMS